MTKNTVYTWEEDYGGTSTIVLCKAHAVEFWGNNEDDMISHFVETTTNVCDDCACVEAGFENEMAARQN